MNLGLIKKIIVWSLIAFGTVEAVWGLLQVYGSNLPTIRCMR